MKNSFFKISNRIIDRITGIDINNRIADAVTFDFQSRDEIDLYQKNKFHKLAEIASQSHYYKGYSGKLLEQFPYLCRGDYNKNLHLLQTQHVKAFRKIHSSGSTATPAELWITKEMLVAKRVSHQKMLNWYGLSRESPEFKIGGTQAGIIHKIYYYVRNKRYYNSHQITRNNLQGIIKKYNRFKPEVLYGYPSTINCFLIYAEKSGIKLHEPKIIITHAENLYPEYVINYKGIFPDTHIANQYWATEANIAETCPYGKLHINEDTVICEVINRDERGVGDLFITNLFSYAVPIIRYDIGDRIRISDQLCDCGRTSKVIDAIEGRKTDYLLMPNGEEFPVTALTISKYASNIESYQLMHYVREGKIVFNYIPIHEDRNINKVAIYDYFLKNFELRTEFKQTNKLEYSEGGKLKKLIVME